MYQTSDVILICNKFLNLQWKNNHKLNYNQVCFPKIAQPYHTCTFSRWMDLVNTLYGVCVVLWCSLPNISSHFSVQKFRKTLQLWFCGCFGTVSGNKIGMESTDIQVYHQSSYSLLFLWSTQPSLEIQYLSLLCFKHTVQSVKARRQQ